jgi:GH25 family lysozyme M1 (1,4-beta-N-acetylmuramidase)
MLAPSRRVLTYVCCAAVSLSLAGFRATSATAGQAAKRADRFNVGATHSPQLLRQLAGPAGLAGGGSPGHPAPGLTPSAALQGARRGVDVASFQHPNGAAINWRRVRASGITFAGVKATEGAYYRNPYALSDLARARAAGVSVVAYAFAIPNGNGASSSPVAQADYLLRYLGSASRRVPVMLDIEYNPYGRECYGLTARAMGRWISSFNYEIKVKTGRKPIMYVPVYWWATCTGSSTGFGRRALWVPYYTTAALPPLLPAGWRTWSFWQYSSVGTVPGIPAPGHTDLDRTNPAVPSVLSNP